MAKQRRHLTIAYPHTGSTKSLTLVGETVFDFFNGKITYPDGTHENIQRTLKEHGFEFYEGLYISTDQAITVDIDGTGKRTFTGIYFERVQFESIIITTTATTKISFIVSTNPSMTVRNSSGLAYDSSGSFTLFAGAVTKSISHGLAGIPKILFALDQFVFCRIINITVTQFTFELEAPIGSDLHVDWSAKL